MNTLGRSTTTSLVTSSLPLWLPSPRLSTTRAMGQRKREWTTRRVFLCKEPRLSEHYRLHSLSWSFFVRLGKLLNFLHRFKEANGLNTAVWVGVGGVLH